MRRALFALVVALVGCDEAPVPPAALTDAEPPAQAPAMEPMVEPRLPEGSADELSLPDLRARIEGLEARGDTEAALADMDVFVFRFAAAPSSARYREVLRAHGRAPRERPPIATRRRTARRDRRPPQGEPRVRVEVPVVRGALDRTLVRRVLARHMGRWRFCHAQTLRRRPDVRGRAHLRFPVTAIGAIPAARVTRSTLGDPELHACLIRMTRQMRFPTSNVAGVNLIDVDLVFGFGG